MHEKTYLWAVVYRSLGGCPGNEKEEKNPGNRDGSLTEVNQVWHAKKMLVKETEIFNSTS